MFAKLQVFFRITKHFIEKLSTKYKVINFVHSIG